MDGLWGAGVESVKEFLRIVRLIIDEFTTGIVSGGSLSFPYLVNFGLTILRLLSIDSNLKIVSPKLTRYGNDKDPPDTIPVVNSSMISRTIRRNSLTLSTPAPQSPSICGASAGLTYFE